MTRTTTTTTTTTTTGETRLARKKATNSNADHARIRNYSNAGRDHARERGGDPDLPARQRRRRRGGRRGVVHVGARALQARLLRRLGSGLADDRLKLVGGSSVDVRARRRTNRRRHRHIAREMGAHPIPATPGEPAVPLFGTVQTPPLDRSLRRGGSLCRKRFRLPNDDILRSYVCGRLETHECCHD